MLYELFAIFGKEYKPKPCASCSTLKEQLAYEREVNKQLVETIASLLKPSVVQDTRSNIVVSPLTEHQSFSRRRAELAKQDSIRDNIKSSSTLQAKPDATVKTEPPKIVREQSINQLEQELGIPNAR